MATSTNINCDARGVPVSDCKPQSLDDFETALLQLQSYFGDPTETLTTTLENDPEFVMGHIFFASALLMMTERQYHSAYLIQSSSPSPFINKSGVEFQGFFQ